MESIVLSTPLVTSRPSQPHSSGFAAPSHHIRRHTHLVKHTPPHNTIEMFSSRVITSTLAVAAILVRDATAFCDEEGPELLCYNEPNGTPQNVTVADVLYVAQYLRAYGGQTQAGRQFTMLAADTPNCEEWTLYQRGSVLALGKHLDPTVDSSVLFADIANTIDGGASATPEQQMNALIGCAEAGGSFGVVYNASNPQYNTATYLAKGYTPAGILVKIVKSG